MSRSSRVATTLSFDSACGAARPCFCSQLRTSGSEPTRDVFVVDAFEDVSAKKRRGRACATEAEPPWTFNPIVGEEGEVGERVAVG